MKKKAVLSALVLCLALGLCACQLALPEESRDRARLIGAFVTVDPLDTYSLDMSQGEELVGSHNPIYAEYYEKRYDEGGIFTANYRFEDLEGLCCFLPTINDGVETYHTNQIDEAFNEVNIKNHSSDIGLLERGVSAELYVAEGSYVRFYLNPVYQDDDGSVYVTAGNAAQGDGSAMALTLKENGKMEINGEEAEYAGEVSIWVKGKRLAEKLRIVELDSEDNVISSVEYYPWELPESYAAAPETVCIMQESLYSDSEGESCFERRLVCPGAEKEDIEVFVEGESLWLEKKICRVNWD